MERYQITGKPQKLPSSTKRRHYPLLTNDQSHSYLQYTKYALPYTLREYVKDNTGTDRRKDSKNKYTYHIKISNFWIRRIGRAIKTTNMKRFGVDQACGVLDPKKATLATVGCDAFTFGQENTNNDRIAIELTNTPDGAAKQFRREWFQPDGMIRRKNLPIEYNP